MDKTKYRLLYSNGYYDVIKAFGVKAAILKSAKDRQHLKADWPVHIEDEHGNEYKAELNIERV